MNLKHAGCELRENRLGSITGYEGTLKDLVGKACGGCLKDRNRCFSTSGQCSHFNTVDQLSVIEGAVIVDHAPGGCSTGHIMWNTFGRITSLLMGKPPGNFTVVSTNMDESDTVFGSIDKLKKTVIAAYKRHKPKVIFITGSCVSAIIADDIPSAIEELQEKLKIPIAYGSCEGIRSKMWSIGFDAAQHAIVKALIKPPEKKSNTVNFIVFWLTARSFLEEAFGALGLEPLILSAYTTPEDYARASQSIATVGQCSVMTSYLGGALEQEYGVPLIREYLPYGITGFESWYKKIASLAGKEAEGNAYIRSQREQYLPEIEKLREKLSGKRVMVALGPGVAVELVRILRDLGLDVVNTSLYHYDPKLDGGGVEDSHVSVYARESDDVDVYVGNAQQHEIYKIIKKYKPEVLISRGHGANLLSARLGVTPIDYSTSSRCLYAYGGALELGYKILDELDNKSLINSVAKHHPNPFTPEFESKTVSDFWVN